MARSIVIPLIMAVLATVSPAAAAEQYYLYAPKQAETPSIPENPADGVLVKTVDIKRGDTLKKISRQYSGRSAFFSQILLFNRIKNPDLIYPGNQLRVPVTAPAALSGGGVEKGKASKSPKHASAKGAAPHKRRTASAGNGGANGHRLFDRGAAAYKKGRYRRALALFEEFLKSYPRSPYAADAALYQADCYLKLAGSR